MVDRINLEPYGILHGSIFPEGEIFTLDLIQGNTATVGEGEDVDVGMPYVGIAADNQGTLTVLDDLRIEYREPVSNPQGYSFDNKRRVRLEAVDGFRVCELKEDVRFYDSNAIGNFGVGFRRLN